jgi:hypothetical protein
MTVMSDSLALADACYELASTIKWSTKPADPAEIAALAERLTAAASDRVFESATLMRDMSLIARAVNYINDAHGMPMTDDVLWFGRTLDTLLEVARPNSGLNDKGRAFLNDMREGINSLDED